eukprot:1564480-Rhodomonas_salina.1
MGYKAHIVSTLDGRRIFITKNDLTIDETKFPWHDQDPNDVVEVTARGAAKSDQPSFVIDSEVLAYVENVSPEWEERVRTRSISAPVVNPEVPAPQQEERDDDNSDDHDPELPSNNQGEYLKEVERGVDELLREIQSRYPHRAEYVYNNQQLGPNSVDLGALYSEITGFKISSKPKHCLDTAAAQYQHYKDKHDREAFITFDQEPKSIEEALARDDTDGWWEAIMSEYQSWKDLN